MTDYKQLCAELLNGYEILLGDLKFDNRLAKRARAALAQPEPEGPTDQEIEEWADACYEVPPMELDVYGWRLYFTAEEFSKTIRAALARWGNHPGFPDSSAADGEMAGIVEWLKKRGRLADLGTKDWYFRAAELLEQLSPPQPVPVSERLPGLGDCTTNPRTGQGQWCWGWVQHDPLLYSGRWRMICREWLVDEATHWLPAHALPLPS